MNLGPTIPRRPRAVVLRTLVVLALLSVLAPARLAVARGHSWVQAQAGLDAAAAAARIWAPDAFLVYLENDESLDTTGASARWGYLFVSPSLKKSRAYSVADGRILVAEDLTMKFDAPPIAGQWLDSGAALRIADAGAGTAFCRAQGGLVSHMLLTRGAFADGDPDPTTWTVVYKAASGPSLFVVIDAAQGKVRRTWRG